MLILHMEKLRKAKLLVQSPADKLGPSQRVKPGWLTLEIVLSLLT